MKSPRVIYLQVLDEYGEESGEITWCVDRVHDTDVEYVRAEMLEQARAEERERYCAAICNGCRRAPTEDWVEPAELRQVLNWPETWVHHVRPTDGEWTWMFCDAAAIRASDEDESEEPE